MKKKQTAYLYSFKKIILVGIVITKIYTFYYIIGPIVLVINMNTTMLKN